MKIYKIFMLSFVAVSLSIKGMDQYSLNKKFLDAAQEGDLEKVKTYLAAGANINFKNGLEETALMRAGLRCNVEMVNLLLKQRDPKVDINAADIGGWTVLMNAILGGNVKIVSLLLGQKNPKVNINAANNVRSTALMEAVLKDDIEIVRLLLKQRDPKVDINAVNRGKWTALMIAALRSDVEIVRLLLNATSKRINETLNPELIEFIEVDIKKALKKINLRMAPDSIEILKAFHNFVRRHPTEFPGLEKEINQLMNQALVLRSHWAREEEFKKMMKYQKALR